MRRLVKIAILGAECTGKSTLAKGLAEHFSQHYPSNWVPEYLRSFVDHHQRTPLAEEQVLIAREQKAHEARLSHALLQDNHDPIKPLTGHAPHALLFCDTTPLITSIYSEVIFGQADALVDQIAELNDYDLTLLTEIDLPWVSDGVQRDGPEIQAAVHQLIESRLQKLEIPYLKISGSTRDRTQKAQEFVGNWLSQQQS
ncbi:ATP-binding protein [Polynucleobacter sp. 30F-ANTBAC]|jgi:nicotinamide riboside kinase|uniref:AAA family ATPase n=1 Tax=Polynucleobacter sp. 30F-ANTBAC TaxID=2689095 RepID=UPI001C0BEBA2|nr:ATP-binding protein [Polynucleobacter sp. 30F-ANTBAC]MBU3599022.1 ATP-binding protein [Polynucleobacter sp. 30F-ANTBAC]